MKKIRLIICLIIGLSFSTIFPSNSIISAADTLTGEIEIWPGVGPGSDTLTIEENIIVRSLVGVCTRDWAIEKITIPTITPVIPDEPQGSAVIICPGGAYQRVVYDVEGMDIGEWLNTIGITAFVLKYRLPNNPHIDKHNVPLQDAQRAIRYVRANAEQWGLDTSKIGIMGFSAGGHMAGSLATLYNNEVYEPGDAVDSINARPDFMLLLYPVVSMVSGITHSTTRYNLLGSSPSPELVDEFSAEKNVTSKTPPTFMARAADDYGVSAENCNQLYQALQDSGVVSELKIFANGGHGVGICKAVGTDFENWPDYCTNWLHSIGMTEDTVEIIEVSGYNAIKNKSVEMNIFPNPISLASTVNYSVVSPAWVNISLYDIMGRQIDVLQDEKKSSGHYSLPLAKYINQLHGVYFLRFEDDTHFISEKIIFQ